MIFLCSYSKSHQRLRPPAMPVATVYGPIVTYDASDCGLLSTDLMVYAELKASRTWAYVGH
jgi:hypothetical protein